MHFGRIGLNPHRAVISRIAHQKRMISPKRKLQERLQGYRVSKRKVVENDHPAEIELRVMIWAKAKKVISAVTSQVRASERAHMRTLGIKTTLEPRNRIVTGLTFLTIQRLELAGDCGVSDSASHGACGERGVLVWRVTSDQRFLLRQSLKAKAGYQKAVAPPIHPMGRHHKKASILISGWRTVFRYAVRTSHHSNR